MSREEISEGWRINNWTELLVLGLRFRDKDDRKIRNRTVT